MCDEDRFNEWWLTWTYSYEELKKQPFKKFFDKLYYMNTKPQITSVSKVTAKDTSRFFDELTKFRVKDSGYSKYFHSYDNFEKYTELEWKENVKYSYI